MYCRFANCDDLQSIEKIVHDLQTGYGTLPRSVTQLVKYHELRVASGLLDIGTMTIDDDDVVIRTKNELSLRKRLEKARGTLRKVGTPSATGFVAVYYRLSGPTREGGLLSQMHALFVESSCLSS